MTHREGSVWEPVGGLISLNLKIRLAYCVSRPGKGFAAGRDFASTGSRAIPPSPRPRNDIISQQSGLSAVVVYRARCAIAINLKR